MVDTCNTLVKNKGVSREGNMKDPMLAIDKLVPSPIITLLEVCTAHEGPRQQDPWSHGERCLNQ